MARIEILGLQKSFGPFHALRDINLTVEDGEFTVLVGPSGCGRSTLLRVIAGLEDLTGGELRIGGRLMNDVAPRDRDIAMVFQSYALYPHLDAARNMGYPLALRRQPKERIAAAVSGAAETLGRSHLLDRRPRARFRAASASGSRWGAPSCGTPRPSSSTNRSPTSTRGCARRCGSRSASCTARSAQLRSTSRTTRSRR